MTSPGKILLDTDILSAIMRQDARAVGHARAYLVDYHHFSFSIITRYEVLRGLLAKGATRQRDAFERLCAMSEVIPLTDEIAVSAAEVYADLRSRGALIGDADILIGATALVRGFGIATNNAAHLSRISSLTIVDCMH